LLTKVRQLYAIKEALASSQLQVLSQQLNPHFLFNTLNTLRDIIDQNPKKDAREFVDKLSNVYRFILESGNSNLTSLREELKFAKSYIHIQTERFGQNLKTNWNIPDNSLELMLVPMSLQLLLENAIKHNVISKAKPLVININVTHNHLSVSNKIQPKSTQLPSTKVGLKNIEKRYNLIAGKSITIENDGTNFKILVPLLKVTDQKN
jgi:LytS/YehU family sensor histidine kinase